jgi:hypothetical protein
MADPNRELFERAVRVLRPLLDELVFVGGCMTGLLVTDTGASGIRPTQDVDAIVEVATYAHYALLSGRLRGVGLVEDTSEGAPLCRWRHGRMVIDVMPTDEQILGFNNRWYIPAIRTAQHIFLIGLNVKVVAPAYFVATKLEAFHGRGQGDVVASHDIEDLLMVIDGRPTVVDEIRESGRDVVSYIASEVRQLLLDRVFLDALSGFLLPDPGSQARRPLLEARLREIAALVA